MDARVQSWLARDPDPNTQAALRQLVASANTREIADAFAGRLSFGTAGLRGILGPGPARMNRLVIRETTVGLATHLLTTVEYAPRRGVGVGYDGRIMSREFAEDATTVLAACGIKAYLFDRPLPTPVCAFAVRELGAAAGVMVTASHNPPEYNGYKVYWANGAQIIPPQDVDIAAAIAAAAQRPIPWCDLAEARRSELAVTIGDALLEHYHAGIAALALHEPTATRARLRIAYSPLHGVGAATALAALQRAGFTDVHSVASQSEPDGRFPTVHFPNPEEPGTMDAVLALAGEIGADLAIANDPDADRLAVAVRRADGTYRLLTGNEVGSLLGWDCLARAPANAVVVSTIVSSRLLGVMARARCVAYAETLTGFKWIANVGLEREAHGERFVFGYEEAMGYSVGGLVRDKDGISALVAMAQLAAALADQGDSILGLLERIAREHGLYVTCQRSLAAENASSLGDTLRAAPPPIIGGRRVVKTIDALRDSEGIDRTLTPAPPPTDVLVYELAGDARVVVRPSGTEPKIKCYYELRETVDPGESFASAEAHAQAALAALVSAHQTQLAG